MTQTLKSGPDLAEIREAHNKLMASYLEEAVRAIFEEFPKMDLFSLRVNNHEFADGEPTSFDIDYYEPSINLVVGYLLADNNQEGLEKAGISFEEYKSIAGRVSSTFKNFKPDLETMFGDTFESITFYRNNERSVG